MQVDTYNLPEIVKAQTKGKEIKSYPNLKEFPLSSNCTIVCDISILFPRPFIPSPLYKSIFNSLYLFAHPGIGSSIQLIKSRYFWLNMNKSIKQNVQYASSQISTDIQNLPFKILNYLPILLLIHIDIFRLLPPVYNNSDLYLRPYRNLLMCIDHAAHWIEL